jgi:hypothetical protein
MDPHSLDLGSSWRWVVRFTPGERAPGTHWIGGPQKRSGRFEEQKILDPRRRHSSSRLPTATARVRGRVSSSGIRGGQNGAGAGFLRVYFGFPYQYIFHQMLHPHNHQGPVTIGQKWPTCRVDPVWTPPLICELKKNCPLSGLDRPARSQSLYRLRYPGSIESSYLLTYLLTELSPSWGAANCAATQELPYILWNLKVQYRVHKSPLLVPILSHINPLHSIPSYLSKIHFIIACNKIIG